MKMSRVKTSYVPPRKSDAFSTVCSFVDVGRSQCNLRQLRSLTRGETVIWKVGEFDVPKPVVSVHNLSIDVDFVHMKMKSGYRYTSRADVKNRI